MRAYVLWQAAHGYQKTAPRRSRRLLHDAFLATLSISRVRTENCMSKDEACRTRQWLQRGILDDWAQHSPEEAKDMAAKADPVILSGLDSKLIDWYIEKKQFDRAEELLASRASDTDYPFYLATQLMKALPASQKQQRAVIFSQALENFRQNPPDAVETNDDDLAGMLSQFWRDLPPGMVTDAIDTILAEAKDAKDNLIPDQPSGMIIQTVHGDIKFPSLYALRMFEVLPVLQKLDSSKAESLLRENIDLQATLDQYPKGLESIPPGVTVDSSGKKETTSGIVNFGVPFHDPAEEKEQSYLFQTYNRISEEAGRDPKRALADALGLPQETPNGHHPQVTALRIVAKSAADRDPQTAKTALAELRKQMDGVKPVWAAISLLEAGEIYLRMKDTSNATATLQEALKWVDILYEEDEDRDDPNLAFKGNWPSASMWGHCLELATKISPDLAERLIAEITDPEIAALERVAYANSLLGAPRAPSTVVEQHKGKKWSMMSY